MIFIKYKKPILSCSLKCLTADLTHLCRWCTHTHTHIIWMLASCLWCSLFHISDDILPKRPLLPLYTIVHQYISRIILTCTHHTTWHVQLVQWNHALTITWKGLCLNIIHSKCNYYYALRPIVSLILSAQTIICVRKDQ